MTRRRRNKIVLWDWSPGGKPKDETKTKRARNVGLEALGATALLGGLIFLLGLIPQSPSGGYRRARLGEFMCETAGVSVGTPTCVVLSIGGWLGIVVAVGIVLKVGRLALRSVARGWDES